ncbi:hypothetical protein GON03_07790 [Nocardioides sp. MAH-18]|uniref:Right handed beta helix domain-containing protein n=1 Tax=Nocardioides agri TaxID=2682843 RepID=A0A6L6XPL7_9ACTN|nr:MULTISPECIES: hypothetical protein [unclassified Nocardioides]MBA2954219.1 hypothetical protein [Nocardioides sp. CGMCC 1.13656]MVQ49080.1 hypothetical protein [Nocardioides sp. MAH-18]
MKQALATAVAAAAVAALVAGGVAVAADGNGEVTANCTADPTVSDTTAGQQITVVCTVPKPVQPTATVTVPGPTVTVTATPGQEPSTPDPTTSTTPTDQPTGPDPTTPTGDPTTPDPNTPTPTTPTTPTPTDEPTNPDPTTPTPTPGGRDWPDASNTGVPQGTALTAYTGGLTITKAGTVIDGKILGCIEVAAPGVVIRNSKITCKPNYAAVTVDDGSFSGAPLLLEDVEIDCQNFGGNAIGEANVTVRRANIHGCENGLDVNQNITVEDSYIHDLFNTAASHTDGIQFANFRLVGTDWVSGSANIVIRHNTIYGVGADGSLGTSAIISNPRNDINILIERNLLAGGAYTLYCDRPGAGINYRVIDNHFSTRFSPKVGAFGPSDGCADEIRSGNVIHETGDPVRLD